jgi:hypothetical protein
VTISFPDINAHWDCSCDVAVFIATLDETTITCKITLEALKDHLQADIHHPLASFHQNLHRIQQRAATLIQQGRFDEDDSILICSADGV